MVEVLAEHRSGAHVLAERRLARTARPAWESRYVYALIGLDVLGVLLGDAMAFTLRFGSYTNGYHRIYLLMSAVLPICWVAALAFNHAYDTRYLFVGNEEYQRVLRSGLAVTATVATAAYASEIPVARGYVVLALPLASIWCIALRFALRHWLHTSWELGDRLRRVIVVGHPREVRDLCLQLRRARYHGLDVVGACLPDPTADHDGLVPVPIYGAIDQVTRAVEAAAADTVIVLSCPEISGTMLRRLGWQMENDDIDMIVASALLDVAGGRTTIRPVDGLPMLHVDHATLRGPRRLIKAAMDRIGAILLLALLLPLIVVIAALVRASSNGPAFFRQVRVGRDGREFGIVKFRTMYQDSDRMQAVLAAANEHDGVLFKIRHDPRVTPIGRFLRRYSLDELPQLFNVLRGEMSLVGPRPPLPSEVAAYPEDMRRRLVVKPGMTGLWQVSGRSDLPWDEVMRLDLRYVENWSLTFDVVILLRTVTAVLRSSGAY